MVYLPIFYANLAFFGLFAFNPSLNNSRIDKSFLKNNINQIGNKMNIETLFPLDPNVKVRTRFAPSPTGYLHVGGARTALYSWLYAKHFNGEFVLRIEDTDLERSTPEATQAILEGMEWLNLAWEYGPYFQTKRFDRYNQVIDQMIEQGLAYRC